MKIMKNLVRLLMMGSFTLLALIDSVSAVPVFRTASGANAAAIQATVDQFRADLGGANNGVNGSFTTGRREINWDGVPDGFSAPNALPNNFFNSNSPRGVIFSSTSLTGLVSNQQPFMVSSTAASGTPVNFGNLDASYTAIFQTFSAQRLFTANSSNIVDVEFVIPGTKIPATVSGFGAVFCDVDAASTTAIQYFDVDGRSLGIFTAPVNDNGLSFIGVSFTTERVARVKIYNGNLPAKAGNLDAGAAADVVVMDDFIYGEPRARDFHDKDFDGDGFADASVFRPSTGTFFVLNSGSSTVNFLSFGFNGDIPVSGDFDGDKRADIAIFRPSNGEWWINRSSTGVTVAAQFGQTGDRPTPGDFDKDGITDIAFWRPSNGNYFVFRSSNSSFFSFQWGVTGDLPVGAAIAP
jgi:hypothetical protein